MLNLDQPAKHCEIVLPDGRFARYRPVTVEEYLGFVSTGCTGIGLVVLISRCVTLDDGKVSPEDLMRMNLSTYWPLSQMVVRQLNAAMNQREVA